MPDVQTVMRYMNLLQGEILESQLLETFPEHINAEVVLRTITSISRAIAWLQTTFLYVRVCKNSALAQFTRSVPRCCLTNLNGGYCS